MGVLLDLALAVHPEWRPSDSTAEIIARSADRAPSHNDSHQSSQMCGVQCLSAAQEAARQQVLGQLRENPNVQRAFVNRFADDGTMILTLAIRGVGTGELLIPAERFGPGSLTDYAVLLQHLTVRGSA